MQLISPLSDSVSLRLRDSNPLTSLHTVTRRLILQKARRHPLRGSDLLEANGFRFFFTPFDRVLFAFPSRYYPLSVAATYLASDRGRPRFRQGFSSLAVLRKSLHEDGSTCRLRGSHPLRPAFPCRSPTCPLSQLRELVHIAPSDPYNTPRATPCSLHAHEFRLFPVRSPLLGESRLVSFPSGT